MRHLISGEDCAIAGEATAATAAPVADTFKKSRRFIQASPCWGVSSQISWSIAFGEAISLQPKALWRGGFNTEVRLRKRDEGMTALFKRKSHTRLVDSGRGDHALELIADLCTDRPINCGIRTVGFALHHRSAGIRHGANR